MRLILRFADGRRSDALLLAESPDRLRVAIPGCDDIVELRGSDGRWTDETGQRVSIEAILPPPIARE